MNITLEGTNNNDLAKLTRVTKQAMSKVAKELQEIGYIKTKTHLKDKRSTIFMLTDREKKLVLGHKEFDNMVLMLEKIITSTDQKLKPSDE